MARRNEGKIALIMILALVAFIIGSAIGISVSLNQQDNQTPENNTTHVQNVTVEMTTNLNKSNEVTFDYDRDYVDFNDNSTRQQYNLTN